MRKAHESIEALSHIACATAVKQPSECPVAQTLSNKKPLSLPKALWAYGTYPIQIAHELSSRWRNLDRRVQGLANDKVGIPPHVLTYNQPNKAESCIKPIETLVNSHTLKGWKA